MKKVIVLLCLVLSVASNAQDTKIVDNSITIHNFSGDEQQVWVNALFYKVTIGSSLRVGCHPGESIETQIANKIVYYDCGSKVELN